MQPQHSYMRSGVQHEKSYSERDLRVQIDSDLKFRGQAACEVTNASQIMSLIRRSFELLDCVTLPLLYKTLVRPHLEYGCTIWGPNCADKNMLNGCRDVPHKTSIWDMLQTQCPKIPFVLGCQSGKFEQKKTMRVENYVENGTILISVLNMKSSFRWNNVF